MAVAVEIEVKIEKLEDSSQASKDFREWVDGTSEPRERNLRDVQFYHGKQWDPVDANKILARKQPLVTYNRIRKKINFLRGQEQRNRTDPKAKPRPYAPSDHDGEAFAITDALRFIEDSEKGKKKFSSCYFDYLTAGTTGMVVEFETVDGIVSGDMHDSESRDIEIKWRPVRWHRLWWDPHSTEPDFSDAKFTGVFTWWNLDDAIEYYSKRKFAAKDFEEVLQTTMDKGGSHESEGDRPSQFFDGERNRVRIVEKYFWVSDAKGVPQCYVSHFTDMGYVEPPHPTGILDENGNNICPLIMESCYVDDDGERYGVVRDMISPQEEINKRRSKALNSVNTNQAWVEKQAVSEPETLRRKLNLPDSIIEFERNALTENRVQIQRGEDVTQGNLALLNEAKAEIGTIGPDSGVPDGISSGRDIQVRNSITSMEIEPVVEPFEDFKHRVFIHSYFGVRQVWTFEKWLRVTDEEENDGYRFVGLNREMTKGERLQEMLQRGIPFEHAVRSSYISQQTIMATMQQAQMLVQSIAGQGVQLPPEQAQQMVTEVLFKQPELGELITVDDVSRVPMDIIIDKAPDTAIVQEEERRELRELAQSVLATGTQESQQLVMPLLKMIIEASGLRGKKRLLKVIEPKVDPQQQQLAKQQQEMNQMLQQIQLQLAQLSLAEKQADIAKTHSEVVENQADAMLKQAKAQGEGQKANVEVTRVVSEARHDVAIAEKHLADAARSRAEARKMQEEANLGPISDLLGE